MTRLILTLSLAALLLAACQPTAPAPGGLTVFVSILPQKYFIERIGGEFVTVNVMVEPGASPATYEPKPAQMTGLSQATAYFSIGVPCEKAWQEKIPAANPQMTLVDTAQGIERLAVEGGGDNPHIWLSPRLVKIQAQNIYSALTELDPAHQPQFKANLEAFQADIEALDAEIRATLEKTESKKFIVFHPAWTYFARDYGLEEIPIEVDGQEPSAQELAALIEKARSENIRVVFVQPEFSQEDAQTIAKEIDGEVLSISTLSPDWLANLRKVAETFAKVLNE